MEDDAHELKELVVKEDELTSPEPHEIKEEVVEASRDDSRVRCIRS